MALHLKQTEDRSQLQNKIAAELKQRLQDREKIEMTKPDPAILDNQRTTSVRGVLVTILIVLIVIALFYFLRP